MRVLELLERAGTRVIHQENRGLSGARMRGVIETAAPYVQPLDADDMLAPGALRRLADGSTAIPRWAWPGATSASSAKSS